MDFASIKSLTIPEGVVTKITHGDSLLWKKSKFTNLVPLSINADGSIYNNGLGYKNGYRVRSGGAEIIADTNSALTGYIKAKGGDTVRIWCKHFDYKLVTNAINVSDSNFTNIGQIAGNSITGYGIFTFSDYASYNYNSVVKESENVYKWVVPPHKDIEYIRVTAYTSDGSTLIVTINEEIEL